MLVSSTKNIKRLKITINCSTEYAVGIYDYFVDKYPDLKEISKKDGKENITKITVITDVKLKKSMKDLYKEFHDFKGIESVSIQEFCEA